MSQSWKHSLADWRVWLALSVLPVSTAFMLSLGGCFRTLGFEFAIAPYSYRIELKADACTVERTFNALRTQWIDTRMEPAGPFDREFWENWYRVSKGEAPWPLLSYHIGYALSPETERIDRDYTVTPSTLVVVPYKESALIAVSMPLLLGGTVLFRRLCARKP